MALRAQTATLLIASFPLAAAASAQSEFRYPARHDHWRKSCSGTLLITSAGISYRQESGKPKKKPHVREWTFDQIQQLTLAPGRIRVLTYDDVRWKLGADREQEFLPGAADLRPVWRMLRSRLDQRLVGALDGEEFPVLWQIPVKHLTRFGGTEGLLVAGARTIAWRAVRAGASRTWRFADIDNVSSSGPFQLTLTTFERSRSHYGNRKGFNFQLKQPLSEERYTDLWRRLNRDRGLPLLTSISETEKQP